MGTGKRQTFFTVYRPCNQNPIYIFPEKEFRGFSPNIHIHVYASDMCVSQDQSTHRYSCSRILNRPIVVKYELGICSVHLIEKHANNVNNIAKILYILGSHLCTLLTIMKTLRQIIYITFASSISSLCSMYKELNYGKINSSKKLLLLSWYRGKRAELQNEIFLYTYLYSGILKKDRCM